MGNDTRQNILTVQPQNPVLTQTSPTKWLRIMLFAVLGLIVVTGSVFFGIQIGKNQAPAQQPIVTLPAASPTELPIQTISPTGALVVTETVVPTSKPTIKVLANYVPGKDWHQVNNTTLGLMFCLPPKWDFTKNGDGSFSGNLTFYRDSAYAPTVAFIQSIPYSSGSRREAYYSFWESEYPDIRTLVSVKDIDINTNSALLISPAKEKESKYSPEGLTVIWQAGGKLWKADIDGWSWVNESQSVFLKDFYTAISCSF